MSAGTGTKPMVILGGGTAGGTAAAALRDEGFGGRVEIISREPGIPFGRPPLSKTYLRSEEDLDGWYVRPADWYKAHDVDLRADSVVAVDPAAHTLALGSGRELGYQQLNVDENPATADTYQVQSIPLMGVFSGGELVKSILGALPKPAIMDELAEFFR